jgi:hypothetical protein
MKPPRVPWKKFPDVLIHAGESAVKKHPLYHAAKSGDADAAEQLVNDTIKTGSITPSTLLLNQKLGISPAPRMLTKSEIELLRQSKQEIARLLRSA